MSIKQLNMAYDCLNSIGNTLDLDTMVSEIIITFTRKTNALSGSFYKRFEDKKPSVHLGKDIMVRFSKSKMLNKKYIVEELDDTKAVILPLKHSYFIFSYDKKRKDIETIASVFGNFQNKINIAVSACNGVQKLEEFNEDLEKKIQEAVQKIRQHEQMLILKSKQAIMGEMIEMIAHQWRQPITAIGMIANNIELDLVLNELNTDELMIELQNINKQVEYLSHTIDDFRDFFKESKMKESFSINELIEKTVSLVEKQLKKKEISIKISGTCDISIYTFKNELIQVLLNIISNSKDAFEDKKTDKPSITIKCEKNNESIKIKLKDNAGGINDDILQRIFEPYFSTKKEKNGSGLGLYMSKIIVDEHLNGDIFVKNIKNGCEFTIQLPINEES
ncbi:HAMP domain-containing sensor histidine kinase [Sulfurimonas sp. HSL-1716]|uniref:sensor histidine kinase n=1 Tax=Hydrocurvibacter sulfurireducens TaxID=3131937 RepID=UPI0031F9D025